MSDQPHGGSNPNMYMVYVDDPTTLHEPYYVECNDLIEALDMTPAEMNVFKAVWRIAAARQGRAKKGAGGLYDAQKIKFFAQRILRREEKNES